MSNCVGIRHEDKYKMERRAPIIPSDMKKLISNQNIKFCVESSQKRIFTDDEYQKAGAEICNNLKKCPIIIGIKEIPIEKFEKNKTYIFFSHVIKGQKHNMPMLKKMMELKCNLIDYEKVENEFGKRIIFFGRFAGIAGMINTLWSFGQRYKQLGIKTPFEKIKQTYKYNTLDEARNDISKVGEEIILNGLPDEISPFIIAFTGNGNVSNGAQEILSLLPVKEIHVNDVINISKNKNLPKNIIYKVVFEEKDMFKPKNNSNFVLEDYYNKPKNYKSVFEKYIPYINGIVNGMYWDERYPRIVTKKYLKKLYSKPNPKLVVVGDITCDANGSIECTHKGTVIDDPVFVYNPDNEDFKMGFKGRGLLIMAVDILPSELPRKSSEVFSTIMKHFIPDIAKVNFNKDFVDISLPPYIKNAMILHKGKLTPSFKYIEEFL